MAREIKFRAWDKETKKMHYQLVKPRTDKNTRDELIIQFDCTGYSARTESKFIGSDCLMQYTGLKDKNGREIFEGDVVKIMQKTETLLDKVIYDNHLCGFRFEGSVNDYCDFCDWLREGAEFEVIGNIYENPKLLNND